MSSWVGCAVSIECGQPPGCFQGTILETDGSYLTLSKPFLDGLPYPKSQVTLKASDIKQIQIIQENAKANNEKQHSTVEVTKSAKKSQKFALTESLQPFEGKSNGMQHSSLPNSISYPNSNQQMNKFQNHNVQHSSNQFNQKQNFGHGNNFSNSNQVSGNSKSKPIDIQGRSNKLNGRSTPNKKEKERRRNEICFGTPSDDPILTEEFDFEKNLALFDKRALWEELNQAQKPDIRQTDHVRRNQSQPKFRHDENILESQPVAHRAIKLPDEGKGPKEYVTDVGLVIPSLTVEFRMKLLTACGRSGLEGAELLGRAGTEVALQLLGGTRRLHPHNTHQMPVVAFLIGPHRQGVVGVTCARQLASHGVSTVVLVAEPDVQGALRPHLSLYQMTGNRLTTNIQDLPSVDLIIMALCDDSDDPSHYPHLAEWANQSRAPVLALDPPAIGTPGIITKYSLLPILPLSHSLNNGKLYLCNLAIPQKIFKDLGIQYDSPFGSKFVIALHPND
ncbi:enhancer of mRNA-decapping protein 3 isoform X2 [Arctopsyche grandis]|uniref:enhancer of mRNA-decapping protein 3 isoform X2 n=1 Tax=Arctopsyche grandis TaxID=121162 RepID=UPI00406D66A7